MSPDLYASDVFDRDALARICAMHEREFANAYDMETVHVDALPPEDYYYFKDNGSKILAVAHLDTVAPAHTRGATFAETAAGLVVHSRALDDRLGAYIILDLLPRLDITFDWLLTVGEESGASTAEFFTTDKEYNWIIEFDRGGTDVVMYQFDDPATRALVTASGARVGDGIFSDISFMDLGVKGFNWGVGYQDYHGPRSHAYLDDTFLMLDHFLIFHDQNKDTRLPHDGFAVRDNWWGRNTVSLNWGAPDEWDDDADESGEDYVNWWNNVDDDKDYVEYPSVSQATNYIERYYRDVEQHPRWRGAM